MTIRIRPGYAGAENKKPLRLGFYAKYYGLPVVTVVSPHHERRAWQYYVLHTGSKVAMVGMGNLDLAKNNWRRFHRLWNIMI